jgi:trans-aconitate 2-methyltransferase
VWQDWSQPFQDLLALVQPPDPGASVLDIGCGTGEHARMLHESIGAGSTLAIDTDRELVAEAERHATAGLQYMHADILKWGREQRFDLIVANAVLQSLADHPSVFARLRELLVQGGQLAAQIPDNAGSVPHAVAHELAGDPRFATSLGTARPRWGTLQAEEYALLVHRLGFSAQRVEVHVYCHVMDSRAAFMSWVEGSVLAWYRRRLSASTLATFVTDYRDRLAGVLPDDKPYVFPSRRLLIWARL